MSPTSIAVHGGRRWFQLIFSAFVVLVTLAMACFGLYLCYLQFAGGHTRPQSTVKFNSLEVTSDLVGVLVAAVSLGFFYVAAKAFKEIAAAPDPVVPVELLPVRLIEKDKRLTREQGERNGGGPF